MKIACVLITNLRAKAEPRKHEYLKDKPDSLGGRDEWEAPGG